MYYIGKTHRDNIISRDVQPEFDHQDSGVRYERVFVQIHGIEQIDYSEVVCRINPKHPVRI